MSAEQYAHQLDAIAARVELPPRFWAKVNKEGPNSCWLWTAALSDTGYGSFKINKRVHNAHRLAYEELVGSIPAGFQVDHLCRVRACVNPDHLEAVTRQENTRRANTIGYFPTSSAGCQRGHDWSETPPRARDRMRKSRNRSRAA